MAGAAAGGRAGCLPVWRPPAAGRAVSAAWIAAGEAVVNIRGYDGGRMGRGGARR